MKNYIQDGQIIDLTAAEELSSGELVQIGDRVGAAAVDIANGSEGSVRLSGVINAAKTTSQSWTVGQKLYMNTSTKALTNVATAGYPFAGICVEAAGSSDTSGKCLLSPASKQAANVAALGQDISATYVEAEVQAISDKVDAILVALKAAGLMANS